MRLGELVSGLPVGGDVGSDVEVRSVQLDSRQVAPGDLFVAVVGAKADGRRFAPEAIRRGAAAVLAAGPPDAPAGVPWLTTGDPRALLAPLAGRLYGAPHDEMTMVGVTGTNGKTSVVWACQHLLDAAGTPSGRIGTLSYTFGDYDFPAARTTPEVSDLLRMLRAMRDRGAAAVCMEVSSHALVLGRLGDVRYDVGVFTNLTRDHLDFHGTMEEYFAAKRRLFSERLKPGGIAVVNVGDAWGERLAAELPKVVRYGDGGDVAAVEARLDESGIHARVATPRGELALESALLGPYNLENLLATIAVGEALGLPHDRVADALRELPPVPGRMERVDRGQGFPVFVDYAHTDDALAKALSAVRRITRRKVLVVFGCGGDRDRGKRPLMGKVAGELADLVLVTSDNPRSEDPLAIMAAVEEGLKASGNSEYRMLPDRRDAIRRALLIAANDAGSATRSAHEGWAVLVAGKGNEDGQEVAGVVHPFSDREEIATALEERARAANGG